MRQPINTDLAIINTTALPSCSSNSTGPFLMDHPNNGMVCDLTLEAYTMPSKQPNNNSTVVSSVSNARRDVPNNRCPYTPYRANFCASVGSNVEIHCAQASLPSICLYPFKTWQTSLCRSSLLISCQLAIALHM